MEVVMADLKFLNVPGIKSALDNDAAIQVAQGKNALLRYRGYVDAYAKASEPQRDMLWESAEEILNAARDKVIAARVKAKDPMAKDVPTVSNVRVSEFRRIMKFGAWQCHRTVLNALSDYSLNFDDLLGVVKYCTTTPSKDKRNGDDKPFNAPAPSLQQCLNAVKARRAEKRGNGESEGPRARDARKAVDVGSPMIEGLLLWFNDHKPLKAKAAKEINSIKVALANLQRIAKSAEA